VTHSTAVSGASTTASPRSLSGGLPVWRLNLMRVGYLLMAVGLAIVKWPLFIQGSAASLPVFEGVVAALLAAMGVLAFVGLRYPVQLLPILVFECLWKSIWLTTIALPHLVAGDMSPEMTTMMSSVLVYVVVIALTPWDYVWQRYVRAPGDPWR
jgi:hypothetical protein